MHLRAEIAFAWAHARNLHFSHDNITSLGSLQHIQLSYFNKPYIYINTNWFYYWLSCIRYPFILRVSSTFTICICATYSRSTGSSIRSFRFYQINLIWSLIPQFYAIRKANGTSSFRLDELYSTQHI